jgi:hypothetical protein
MTGVEGMQKATGMVAFVFGPCWKLIYFQSNKSGILKWQILTSVDPFWVAHSYVSSLLVESNLHQIEAARD